MHHSYGDAEDEQRHGVFGRVKPDGRNGKTAAQKIFCDGAYRIAEPASVQGPPECGGQAAIEKHPHGVFRTAFRLAFLCDSPY